MTHSLTAAEADRVNALTGFSREQGLTPAEIEANPGAVEGDSYDTLNGVVVVGAREDGTLIGFVADDVEPESEVTDDENPVDVNDSEDKYRAVWPNWDSLSDDEKRSRVYGTGKSDERVTPPSA